jgi:hypothetical protein
MATGVTTALGKKAAQVVAKAMAARVGVTVTATVVTATATAVGATGVWRILKAGAMKDGHRHTSGFHPHLAPAAEIRSVLAAWLILKEEPAKVRIEELGLGQSASKLAVWVAQELLTTIHMWGEYLESLDGECLVRLRLR